MKKFIFCVIMAALAVFVVSCDNTSNIAAREKVLIDSFTRLMIQQAEKGKVIQDSIATVARQEIRDSIMIATGKMKKPEPQKK